MKKITNLRDVKIIKNFTPTNILATTHFVCRKCHDVYLADKETVSKINKIYQGQMNDEWNQSAYGTNCDFSEMDKYIKCNRCDQRMRNHYLEYERKYDFKKHLKFIIELIKITYIKWDKKQKYTIITAPGTIINTENVAVTYNDYDFDDNCFHFSVYKKDKRGRRIFGLNLLFFEKEPEGLQRVNEEDVTIFLDKH